MGNGIDLSKVTKARAEIEQRMNKGDRTPVTFWKPNAGSNSIRILPPWTQEGEHAGAPWREAAQHWNVHEEKKAPILCPKRTPDINEPCPICDFIDELRTRKDDIQAQQLAKDLRAKSAYFFNIVDLNDPVYTVKDIAEAKQARPDAELKLEAGDLKVQVYAAGPTIFNQILGVIAENQVDITDPFTGHNITLKKTGKALQTRYEVVLMVKSTPLEGWSEDVKLPSLDEIGFKQDYNKILETLTEGKGGDFSAMLPSGSAKAALPSRGTETVDDLDDLPESYAGGAGDESDLEADLKAAMAAA